MKLRDQIDTGIAWLKWPAALLSLLLLPGSCLAAFELLASVVRQFRALTPFFAGVISYLLLWGLWLKRSRFSFFLTLEHELTHAVFAWLTLHRVTNLRATASRGGVMEFVGRGNWLITIAPYFVPLLSIVLLLCFALAPSQYHGIAAFLIGASLAYHVTTKAKQTHAGQSDLRTVGFAFAFAVLPTANLIVTGMILAWSVHAVSDGATETSVVNYLQSIIEHSRDVY